MLLPTLLGTSRVVSGDDGDGGAATGVQRMTQRVPLPNNSLCVMGLETNARWVHGVHTDKRPENTKDPAERGPRISLTFRHIGTFLRPLSPCPSIRAGQERAQVQQHIFGHGVTGKTRRGAARRTRWRGSRVFTRSIRFGEPPERA
jgi:hypothetical protein